jgi:hypothetical protein
MIGYAVFAGYAVIAAILSGGRDKVWAVWAACGYAVALLLLWRLRRRAPAVLISVALALVAPLLWLSTAFPLEDGMVVIDRSATLLLHHGSPYLSAAQITWWLSYNPYLPVMTLFGLPNAAGLPGLAGNPGFWLAIGTLAVLAAAFWIAEGPGGFGPAAAGGKTSRVAMPNAQCGPCRRDALLGLAVAAASPVIALNLAVITTDPPVLALMLLSLALCSPESITNGKRAVAAGAVLGVACALKSTAWLAVPVLAAMFAARDGRREALRFTVAAVVSTVALTVALAPAVLFRPGAASALVQNSVLFPLGLTRDKTPAASLLPGHLLTSMGTAGHVVSVGLLLAAGLAVAVSLLIRPPRDVPAAAGRLAVGLTLMFLLGPDVRFGYFIYPLGLVVWLALTPQPKASVRS